MFTFRRFNSTYTTTPYFVQKDSRLTTAEKNIYSAILYLDQWGDGCYATNDYFMERYGLARSTVSHALTRLEALGYIRRERPRAHVRYLRPKVYGETEDAPDLPDRP